MSTENKLWIISIQYHDDIYAASSYEVAQLMKADHDMSMTEWIAIQHANGQMLRIRAEDMMAVIKECDDPKEHAELMEKFGYTDWDITEGYLRNSVDPAQQILFDQNGEKA